MIYNSFLMIYLFQIHEWSVMLYLILTQKGRDVNQILYEHYSESMHHSQWMLRRSSHHNL